MRFRLVTVLSLSEAKKHIGHDIELVGYGKPDDPQNIAVECTNCMQVLQDWDKSGLN